MSVDYEIKITSIATSTVNTMNNVVKRVDFVVRGTKQGYVYEIPESTDLADPTPELFKDLSGVVEADVVEWVTANYTNLDATKQHVEFILNTLIAKGELTPTPLPWANA